MFRVIIAGGRDFDNYELLKSTMDKLLSNVTDDICIVSGMARGADTLGKRYAKERGYQVSCFPANWELHGKSAGYIRNRDMALNADALVAFWDGESKGTKDMIRVAKEEHLRIRVKRYTK